MMSSFLVPSFRIIDQKLRKLFTPGIFEDAQAQHDIPKYVTYT